VTEPFEDIQWQW